MAVGTSILSLLGNQDPRQQLLQSIIGQQQGGAQYADQQAGATGTSAPAGSAPSTPDPQPEGLKSPPDLASMYGEMMKYNARATNIDRGFALVGGAIAQDDNRANVMNAFMPSGEQSGMVSPEQMYNLASGIQKQQQAKIARAAQLAALPSIAKQYGLSLEAARMMFETGGLDEIIKNAEKPNTTTVTGADGRILTIDQNQGAQIGEALGPAKPRETRSFTDANGQQRTIYVDTGEEVGGGVGPFKRRETRSFTDANGQQRTIYVDDGTEVADPVGPAKPADRTNDEQNYDRARRDFTVQNPDKAATFPGFNEWLEKQKKIGANQTNVDLRAEGAEQGKMGGYWGQQYEKVQTVGQAAMETMSNYDIIEKGLESGVRTGAFGESEQALRKVWQAIDPTDKENTEKVVGGELIQKVGNKMALLMRNPDSGMGMPGSLSDKDLQFLKDSQLGLSTTGEGNKLTLEVFRRMETRKMEMAEAADDWVAEKGTMRGFNKHWREWSKANPMFDDLKTSDYVKKDSSNVQSLVDKYRTKK